MFYEHGNAKKPTMFNGNGTIFVAFAGEKPGENKKAAAQISGRYATSGKSWMSRTQQRLIDKGLSNGIKTRDRYED